VLRPLPFLLCSVAFAQTPLAIVDVNVVDVVKGAVRPHQTVVIADGRIEDLGAADGIRIPARAVRVPGEGRYLIPGLWDMHIHLRSDSNKPDIRLVDENAALLDLFLPNGVVGVRDMAGDLGEEALRWREEIRTGKRTGPRILTAVRKIDEEPPAWPGSLGVKTPEEAREAVRQNKQLGADFIKVYFNRTPAEVLKAVIDEAHRLNLRVAGHWPVNLPIQDAAEMGMDEIEHGQFLLVYRPAELEQMEKEIAARKSTEWPAGNAEVLARRMYMLDDQSADAVYRAMAAKPVWVTPTLTVMKRVREELGSRDFSEDARQRFVFPAVWASWDPKIGGRKPPSDALRPLFAAAVKRSDEAVLAAHKAGVPMLAGTDCGVDNAYMFPGWSMHEELASLVADGFTTAEALRMATIDAARWRGEEASEGSVDKGKIADLVLLRSDPLQAIRHTTEIEAVVQRGRYFSRQDLDAMLSKAEARASAARTAAK